MNGIRVVGQFLGSERRSGSFEPNDQPGKSIAFDYTVLSVLTGRKVTEVRLPRDVHVHPFVEGDMIDLGVTIPKDVKTTAVADEVIPAASSAA